MPIAVKPRRVLGAALLGVLVAVALMSPSPASAADVTCKGSTEKAQDNEDFENAIGYAFACTGRIVGYTLLTSREIDAFDTEVEVVDSAGAVVQTDAFACQGDIPGLGVGCFGSYSTNNFVRGVLSVSEAQACAEPRVITRLVVVLETIDPITDVPTKTSKGTMAGPFEMGRPRGCPKSSLLAGFMAEVNERMNRILGKTDA
ncbi:MAG: hypothetical protein M3376_09865 [Actinomycetota bacterium]|nr:hypothetical protein [Actinomycetota bacterium]